MVTVYLTANKTIGSYLIRFVTWSKWSHVFIQDGDDAIEANWLHGVRRVSLTEALSKATNKAVLQVKCQDDTKVIEAIKAQIGKPYDFMALLGFLFKRDWQRDDSWECAELVAYGFAAAGEPVFRSEDISRVSPGDWWKISPDRLEAEFLAIS